MQRKFFLFSLVIFSLILTSCGGTTQPTSENSSPQRWMTVAYIEGAVELQETIEGEWHELSVGQVLSPNASLRTAANSLLHVEINEGSAFLVGPESLLSISQFSPGLENTLTTLDLQQGGVFAVSMNSSMGSSGSFEIKTAALTLSIASPQVSVLRLHGLASPAQMPSGYIGSGFVTIVEGKTPQEAATQVGMVSGNGTITFPGGDTRLAQTDEYIEVNNNTQEITIIPPELMEEAARLGVYYLPRLIYLLTGTPAATPSASSTSIPKTATATWTPFPTFEKPTQTTTANPLPTHRSYTPDAKWTPGADGLSLEEIANSGSHIYSHSCISFGDCICSPDSSVPGNITFSANSVTLFAEEAGTESISYYKSAPNVYSLSQGMMEATITFYIDGWDFVVNKNGGACSYQTFLME